MEIPDFQKLDKWEDTIDFPSVSAIFFIIIWTVWNF